MLTGRGQSEKEVAQQLDISPNTVRVHIENIKRKLGASNKSHALILSLLLGETELNDFDEPEADAGAIAASASRKSGRSERFAGLVRDWRPGPLRIRMPI